MPSALLRNRLGEYEALGRRMGICGVEAYLARISRREVILVYVEVEDPDQALRLLAALEEPFEKWLKERLRELDGYDLGRWRIGSSPELVFDRPGSSKLP